ncbi:hypothetical protein ILYODFUR_027816 [Ilyodon furcidens]|uniref:Uncharacterized protein n=1 Tax=Ilyodon furcidens TaxID=33524 RepID=A0ABV0ULF4_9TELE
MDRKMISVCLVHGGIGPHFFSERLYQQICGISSQPTLVEKVDTGYKTVMEANEAIMVEADSLSIIGVLRRVSTLEEKDSLMQSAADFFVNGRVHTALEQFVEGLRTLGLLEEMQKHSGLFYDLSVRRDHSCHWTGATFLKCVFLCKAATEGLEKIKTYAIGETGSILKKENAVPLLLR